MSGTKISRIPPDARIPRISHDYSAVDFVYLVVCNDTQSERILARRRAAYVPVHVWLCSVNTLSLKTIFVG